MGNRLLSYAREILFSPFRIAFSSSSSENEKDLKITRSGAVFSSQSRSSTKDFREYTKDEFSKLQLIFLLAIK